MQKYLRGYIKLFHNNVVLEGDFDFKVILDPHTLRGEIIEKRGGRLLAGYAWGGLKILREKNWHMML